MIWDIKYQAGKSPQITQFNKSSKQVINTELQCSTRVPVQMLPLGVISPLTVQWERTDSPGTGEFPRNHICVKQAAGSLKTVQFKAHLLHLLDQRQQINPFILPRRKPVVTMTGIPRRITNYIIYIIAEHFCNPHSDKQTNKIPFPKTSILHHYFISGLLLEKMWFKMSLNKT